MADLLICEGVEEFVMCLSVAAGLTTAVPHTPTHGCSLHTSSHTNSPTHTVTPYRHTFTNIHTHRDSPSRTDTCV